MFVRYSIFTHRFTKIFPKKSFIFYLEDPLISYDCIKFTVKERKNHQIFYRCTNVILSTLELSFCTLPLIVSHYIVELY